ncbi:hypothetical protein [Secundilactobacillus malefermentans]|uniref:DUF2187 domain-containing protein n=1 Tax=Secundilactobacillus malefermentans TaxID=176292 RepID=A0A4R5NU89_9LACO|nr:hypothetical protein [Secundilactobacillus malefermentans]QEA32255.1 hypothetical protein FGL90_08770 [Secundilactobacillus malefermentans]TDG80533.1 hypothetical protein C5L31_001560 [Secundilactobacillus malefermentans]
MQKFQQGELVRYESAEELQGPVIGKVIQVLQSNVVIEVLNFYFKDRQRVSELNFVITACPTELKSLRVINYGN